MRIFAGNYSVFAIHPQNNDIYRIIYRSKTKTIFDTVIPEELRQDRIGGPSADFAVGIFDEILWGLSLDRSGIYQFNEKTTVIITGKGLEGWR